MSGLLQIRLALVSWKVKERVVKICQPRHFVSSGVTVSLWRGEGKELDKQCRWAGCKFCYCPCTVPHRFNELLALTAWKMLGA